MKIIPEKEFAKEKVRAAIGAGDINLAEGFHLWSPERRINYLHKLASSLNHACETLLRERNEAIAYAEQQGAQNKAALIALDQQASVYQGQLLSANDQVQQLMLEITDARNSEWALKAQLRKLEGADGGNGRMGH